MATLTDRIDALIRTDVPDFVRDELRSIFADVRDTVDLLSEVIFDEDMVGGKWPDTLDRIRTHLAKVGDTPCTTDVPQPE